MTEPNLKAVIKQLTETAFGKAAINRLIRDEVGALTVALINQHVAAGRFMNNPDSSNDRSSEGYSTATLPAFFLGDIQKAGEDWQIRSTQFNVTVNPNDDQFIWRWNQKQQKSVGYLVGGYKAFKELAGRSTSIVNLTFTGRMMNSVNYRPVISNNSFRVEVGATGGNEDKAYYTDRQREWLVLFGDEQEKIIRESEKYIVRQIDKLGDFIVKT